MKWRLIALLAGAAVAITGCSKSQEGPAKKTGAYRLFVTNEGSGDMTVIESPEFAVIAAVKLGKRPRGIHASPDKSVIFVALSGTPPAPPGVDESTLPPPDKSADGIAVVDVPSKQVVRVLEGGSDPENFDISADGKTIYVSNEDAEGVSFVDVSSGKLIRSTKVGGEPEGVKLSPDGKFIYVTSEADGIIGVVDTKDGKLIKTFKTGRRPRSIAFMADGQHAYINAENDATIVLVDSVKHEMIKAISLGEPGVIKPMGVLLSGDGGKLYVTSGRGHKLFIVDTATNAVTTSFEVGQRPWGLALSPDGKTLFTANGPSDDISVIDLATQKVLQTVKCGKSPWGIVVLPL